GAGRHARNVPRAHRRVSARGIGAADHQSPRVGRRRPRDGDGRDSRVRPWLIPHQGVTTLVSAQQSDAPPRITFSQAGGAPTVASSLPLNEAALFPTKANQPRGWDAKPRAWE